MKRKGGFFEGDLVRVARPVNIGDWHKIPFGAVVKVVNPAGIFGCGTYVTVVTPDGVEQSVRAAACKIARQAMYERAAHTLLGLGLGSYPKDRGSSIDRRMRRIIHEYQNHRG